MDNSPFKTTWAGMNDKIHAPKTSWSTGNPTVYDAKPNIHIDNPETVKMNRSTHVHMWILSGLLSWQLHNMKMQMMHPLGK